jgi:pimeloyl-ACP methyl ester carboxylesterase
MSRVARLVVAACLASCGAPTVARWRTLPAIPPMPSPAQAGDLDVGDARIHYAVYGQGRAVVLLHGGLGNGDYMVCQLAALAPGHRVVVIDSRGHGRSTLGTQGLHYALMGDDVIKVLDALHIDRASLFGWSDGAIISLDLAVHHGERVERVFAFGANADPSGLVPSGFEAPAIKGYIARAGDDTTRLSNDPKRLEALSAAIGAMYEHEPAFTDAELRSIRIPVVIADGDHEEIIAPAHTAALAKRIPGAKLVSIRDAGHLAPWQAHDDLDRALVAFIDGH